MSDLVIRKLNESNKDKLVIYQIDGVNYSEFLIETIVRKFLDKPDMSYDDHYGVHANG